MTISRRLLGRKSILLTVVALLMITLIFSACGSQSKMESTAVAPAASAAGNTSHGSVDISYDQVAADEPDSPGGFGELGAGSDYKGDATVLMDQRKIIMEGNVSLEAKDFDKSIDAMDQLIIDYDGFAESRTVKGKSPNSRALRNANYVIRVPAESFESVLLDMGNIGFVLESNSKGTDITDKYVDFETRVRTLKVQEETLLEILDKSTELEDVIKLESRIAEVRYEIESIENQLRNYDRLIAYSRIAIYIHEVDDATETVPVPKTLGQRINSAFSQSVKEFRFGIEDFLVWIVGSWISLIILAVIICIIIICIKKRKRKRLLKTSPISEVDDRNVEDKEKENR